MMLLEAISPSRYVRELSLAASFTVDHQWPSGSWYYFGTTEHGGDTSHTQYAVLGLWAGRGPACEFRWSVWSRVADWHLKNQNEDRGIRLPSRRRQVSTHSMTVNGVASLRVALGDAYPMGVSLSLARCRTKKKTSRASSKIRQGRPAV